MQRTPREPSPRSRHRRRHADAVIQAEVRRLARAPSRGAEADHTPRILTLADPPTATVRILGPEPT